MTVLNLTWFRAHPPPCLRRGFGRQASKGGGGFRLFTRPSPLTHIFFLTLLMIMIFQELQFSLNFNPPHIFGKSLPRCCIKMWLNQLHAPIKKLFLPFCRRPREPLARRAAGPGSAPASGSERGASLRGMSPSGAEPAPEGGPHGPEGG